MAISVKNYTNRFVVIVILIVMAVWAVLFYAILMDEVYDNIDDGLKNQKIEIIREAYKNPSILQNSKEFGINQFVISALTDSLENIDKNVFTKEFIYMPYDEEDEPYRVLRTGFYASDGKPFLLELRTSTVEEDDFLINLAISLSVLYVVIILSVFLINHFVFTKAWKPFNTILGNLDRYRFGNVKSFDTIASEVKEFNTLNTHIQSMIARNEDVFTQQKQFLENASHELQTPLTISINKLALVLEEGELNEHQMNLVVEAKNTMHRMVSLNKSLLMLSRIDNKQYTDLELVNFNAVFDTLQEDLQDLIEFKNITLNREDKAIFETSVNPNLAQILLSNLLKNAIRYNVESGVIDVLITENSFTIANTSTFGALNPTYLYQRFYKGVQDNNSNGLGLSIVQSILESYPFLTLNYSYQEGKHLFEIKK